MATDSAQSPETPAGRRRHSRLRVRLPARLITLDGTFHVTMIDLSRTGAKVALDLTAPQRGQAVLEWGKFEAFCSITWAQARVCGLDFDEPLADEVLKSTRRLADTTTPVDGSRAAARAWVAGMIRL